MALNKLNHIYGEPLLVSSLNVEGNTVLYTSLTVLGAANLNSASIGAVSNAEIQYLTGLTGNIQSQLNGKITAAQVATSYAALSGATFTGAISATGLTLTNDLTVANGGTGLSNTTKGGIFVGTSTTAFVNVPVGLDGYLLTADSSLTSGLKWAPAPVSLPSQTSNSGKYLTTDGTNASWATVQALPTQTGNAGKFLTTDATTASWATLTASLLTGGTLSSTILGNSSHFIGTTSIALNRASANLALTGITSVALPGSTSGTITLQPAATAGTNTITLPAATGTVDLVGNSFFVGTTSIANNRASAAQTLTGVSIDGNAATATTASGVSAANISGTTLNAGVTASSLTSVGTITTGTWSGSFGAVSGANLTSLTAGNLNGTIPTGVLGNSSHFIGTTSIALNRASLAQTLTGVSIDGNAATATTASGVSAANISGTTLNSGVTASSLTSVGTISTGTWSASFGAVSGANLTSLTAGNLLGTIPSAVLGNSTVRIGTTAIALNRASLAQTLTGVSIDGNAATVTNGITTTNYNSYSPTLTGGSASGTWGINITGNAATATTASSATNGLTTTNYSTYAIPKAGGTLTGLLIGAPGTSTLTISNHNDAGNFSVRSVDNAGAAAMSFHRPGIYATNMGIDTDNVFKIGGWSAGIMISLTGSNCTLPGTLTINSDIKLKENLVPITGALEKVHALTGYNYNRIGSEKLEMGVVAQEVQAILPELVEADSEGTLSVAYQNMVALLIEAVKEQSAEIAALKEQVKELKG